MEWTSNGSESNLEGGLVRRGRSGLPASDVTRNKDHWRRIAYRTWRRNASKPLVTFAFDDDDRLIGQIEVPAATLDHEELDLYIETLARECDRFEYVLTGADAQ